MTDVSFTPTEERILEVLGDGVRHKRKELHRCLSDELTNVKTIQFHLSKIRQKIRPMGRDIVCIFNNQTIWYQMVQVLDARKLH